MSVVDLQLNCTFSRTALHIERCCFLSADTLILDVQTPPGPGLCSLLRSCGYDTFSELNVMNLQSKHRVKCPLCDKHQPHRSTGA